MPLCESRCEGIPQHERECAFLRENCKDASNQEMADADLITLMRAALLITQDPGTYEKVMALESNKGSKVLIREGAIRSGRQIISGLNFR